MTVLLWILAVAAVVVGLIGVVLPAVPGHVLILTGLVLGAWADGFTQVGPWTLALIAAIAIASYGIDALAVALGARHLGASPRAMVGAALGTLLVFVFGIPGMIVGPFLGAVIGELTVRRDLLRAGRIGVAAWIGFLIGAAVKVGSALLMIAIFLTAFFF